MRMKYIFRSLSRILTQMPHCGTWPRERANVDFHTESSVKRRIVSAGKLGYGYIVCAFGWIQFQLNSFQRTKHLEIKIHTLVEIGERMFAYTFLSKFY